MRVDLPDPLAPRIPWMSPRSRRIDTFAMAVTGFLALPTTNDLLTPSMSRAGTPDETAHAVWRTAGASVCSCSMVVVAVTVDSGWREVDMERAADLIRRFVGGPRGSVVSSAICRWGREGHQKSRGPDLAHGSWRLRKAVLPPAASSRWAQRLPRSATPIGAVVRRKKSFVVILEAASIRAGRGRATCVPVGSLGRWRGECQPGRTTMANPRRMT